MTISYSRFQGAQPVMLDALPAQPRSGAAMPQQAVRKGFYRTYVKRALDVTAILLAAPIVVPIVAALAFAVSRDGGKAFYTQQRVGRHGRAFRMWKLRSMVPDADERMEAYLASNPLARAEWDKTQKLKNDPRITSFGRFLRKSSLDERTSCRSFGTCSSAI